MMAALTFKTGCFSVLYRHFVVATSKLRPIVLKDYKEAPELPWEEVSAQIYSQSVRVSEPINSVFQAFCQDGDRYLATISETEQQTSPDEQTKIQQKRKLYERAIEEYLIFRSACENEQHIMMLNRVGQEKDLRAIIQNTAKHVGLAMPKGWKEAVKDPFEKQDTNKEPTK